MVLDYQTLSKIVFGVQRFWEEDGKLVFRRFTEKPVYVLLPIWRRTANQIFTCGTLDEVRDAIAAEAAKYPNAVVINGRDLSPSAMAFMNDGTHPSALGHTHYAMNLAKRIRAYENEKDGKNS